MSENASHWDNAYAAGDEQKSWYQPHAQVSFELIGRVRSPETPSVIDVGGGATTLTDDLLAAGFADLTVVDISDVGMALARARLGADQAKVAWVCADITLWRPSRTFDVWHDRAVLHFLTDQQAVRAYREAMLAATATGSSVIIGVFGADGPTQCSGLQVRRYSAEDLAAFLGREFTIDESFENVHETPFGTAQKFQWVRARRH